jgi:regulator of replication initiation timing
MFNIFKKIKQLEMTKQELEQQNVELKVALDRANTANRELNSAVQKLKEDFESAVERVRYLDGQIKMKDARKQAAEKYNDNDRNY